MIVGIGLDLVDVGRIARAMQNPRFVRRVLTDAERVICRSPEAVAGRWAAKEAIAKALGKPMSWRNIEILPGPTGAPMPIVNEMEFLAETWRLFLTITHERTHAAAVAIIETR